MEAEAVYANSFFEQAPHCFSSFCLYLHSGLWFGRPVITGRRLHRSPPTEAFVWHSCDGVAQARGWVCAAVLVISEAVWALFGCVGVSGCRPRCQRRPSEVFLACRKGQATVEGSSAAVGKPLVIAGPELAAAVALLACQTLDAVVR